MPWCRELWPMPRLEMNPVDAERIDATQGDWVWIETNQHKIRKWWICTTASSPAW
ncbi:MAG: hypothetical protein ACLTDR_04545 [Adlercreutzia equolifaciens]